MLDTINTMLTDALGPLGPLLALGFLGVMLVIIALSVNLLGDWLRDALNPRLR